MRYYIGIDPGLSGAFAVMNEAGEVVAVEDLPVVEYKAGRGKRRKLDARTLAHRFDEHAERGGQWELNFVLEDVHSMPKQGVATTFRFGQAFGVIEGVVGAQGWPYRFVTPQKWKKAMGIPKDKDAARLAVIQRYPEAAEYLTRKKDHNRAEAVVLADWLRKELA